MNPSESHSFPSGPARRRLQRRAPAPLALEPRLVFDGDAGKDVGVHAIDPGAVLGRAMDPSRVVPLVPIPAKPPVEHTVDTRLPTQPATDSSAKEVVFLDTSVADWQTLAANAKPGVQVILLDPAKDGFAQVEAALAGRTGLTAIHLVSHGQEGTLLLGSSSYTADNVAAYADALAQIGRSLAPGGDVLVYGCNVAQGADGAALIGRLAAETHADVAASTDATGAAKAGANWTLERATGRIQADVFLTDAGKAAYGDWLSDISLSGKTGWTAVMYGASKDPVNDTQAGAADTDIVGDANHGSLYVAYETNGTTSTADDMMVFRMRIGNPTSTTYFGGVAVVGIDANGDGRIDVFVSVDGRNNGQVIRILDPGTDANISPSTTSTSPLPTGWLANNGVYAMTSSNYSVTAVSSSTDPNWDGTTNIGNDGGTDVFISWKVPIADIATVLAKASPTDRSGNYGPRGSTGIAGFGKDTTLSYVSFTQTQSGPINGDINGVGASYDKNASFSSLGAYTAPMSPSNPVSASNAVKITTPISTDGYINNGEKSAVSISGTSTGEAGQTITISISDGVHTAVTKTGTVNSDGTWTVSGMDVSSLNEGSLTVSASAPSAADSTNVTFDKTVAVGITQLATTTAGKPTLSGTSDLPDGSLVTLTLDADNNAATANLVYQVLVSGGAWTLDTSTVAPVSGTMPSGGLTAYTKITATATDAAGNSATATALNHPTVTTLSTNSTAPTISGTWTNISGDTLTVTINGATYSPTISGNTWSLDLSTATPTSGTKTALVAGHSYEVTATVTRDSSSVSDVTTTEVTVTNTPVVSVGITSGTSGTDTTPTITGTSANAGGFVIVRLDPGNDGDLSDAVSYSVTPDGSGNWTLDTGTVTPISGTKPTGGFIGNIGVHATDSTGAVAADQTLTISTPAVSITGITSTATADSYGKIDNGTTGKAYLNMTEDNAVTISGSATDGFTVDVVVEDANGNSVTATGLAVSSGAWSATGLDLSSLDNSTLTVKATLSGTSISATDTSVTHDKLAPVIYNTTQSVLPKNSGGTIKGTSDLPSGTAITVTLYSDSGYTTPISGQTYSTTVAADGSWTVATTSSLSNGITVYVKVATNSTVTDTAGNIAQPSLSSRTVSQSAGNSDRTIDVKPITGDNAITVSEIGSGLAINGETNQTSSTVTVTVTDGTTTITKTATSGSTYTAGTNNWSVSLTAAEVQSLKNGQLTVTAKVTDTTKSVDVTDVELPTLSLATPTLAITDNVAGTAAGDVTFTFTFSEAVTGFDASDITVTNGVKGTFSGSGTTYTLVVTPTSSSSGNITVSVAGGAANGANTGRANSAASDVQAFDTTGAAAAPTVTINTTALATNSTPTITGTTSLSAGAPVVISIDTNNDGTPDLTYSATVQSGGTWSLDLSTATPTSGTLSASGLAASAKITATATNAYGNSASATGLNKPTVTSQVTNDNTPTVTGTWTQVTGDTLSVVVNGVTYSVANGNLTVTATGWSLTPTTALGDSTYSVNATVTRSSSTVSDPTSSELVVDTTATVTISGGATADTTGNSKPTISGTTTGIAAGTVLTLNLDTNNDGTTDLVYKTTVKSDGTWSVDTSTATPTSGTLSSSGLNGAVPITATATDQAGNVGTDTQTLTVDVTPPEIALTFNSKTTDTTPLITGTTDLPSGSTITVDIDPNNDGNWSDKQTYSATVQTDGSWSVEATTALSGTVNVKATGTDSVGNSTSTMKTLNIGATAPTLSITSPLPTVGSDNVANSTEDDGIIVLGSTGNLAAGTTVAVTITDGTTTIRDTAKVQADGSWALSALNLSSLANGTIDLTAVAYDTDGSAYTATSSFTHDKSATVAIDSISQDTGVLSDFITKDNTVSISGTATANSSVSVTVKDSGNSTVASFTVTSNSSGAWTTADTSALAAGDYTIAATVGGTTATKAMTIVDATAPTLSASSPADNATNVTASANVALTFSKNVQAGTGYISLYKADGTLVENFDVATGAGDAGGTIVFNGTTGVTLDPHSDLVASGSYYVKIDSSAVSDSAGNTYAGIADSTTLNFTVASASDTTAPAAPTVALTSGSDSGSSHSDAKTNVTTPVIRVTLNGSGATAPVSGDTVKLYDGSTQVGTATLTSTDITAGYVDVTSSGRTAGALSYKATITDSSSNVSADSNSLAVTLDTTAPVLSTATVSGTSLVLSYTEAGVGFDSSTPAATAFVVKDGATTISVSNVAVDTTAKTVTLTLASAVANGDTVKVSYTGGANKLQDIAGNVAADLTNQTVTNNTADTTAPAAPSIALTAASDSGSSNADAKTNVTTPVIRVTFNGSGATAPVAGDTVKLYDGVTQVGTATLTSTDISAGYVDVTSSARSAGALSYKATITDAVSNVSADSNTLGVRLDTTAPVLSTASVSGTSLVLTYTEAGVGFDSVTPSTTDFVVKDGGSTINVSNVAVDTSAKTVTLTLSSAVANGDTVTVSYTAGTNKLQDIAGNTAANLTNHAVTNGTGDTTPPAKPVVSGISTDTGDSSTDGLTKDQTLVISGTAEANSTVTVFVDGTSVGTTTADGSGNWSYDYTGTTLAEGSHAITAKATDAANNTSAASDAFTAKIDITATTSVTTPSDTKLSATEDGSVSLSGTVANVEDGNTITVTFSDGTHSVQKTATIAGGAWSVTGADLSTLNEGSVNVTTSVADDAGNVSTTTNNALFTIDRTAPSKPVVTSISTDSGTSGSDGKTNDATLTISGTAEANSTVQVLIGGTSIGTVTADGSGNWSLDHTGTSLAEGSYSITAKATDAAGNTSATSNAFTAVVDTTVPVLSTASVSGTSLVLTYTEAGVGFDTSTPATTDFVVKDGASTISVSNVAVDTTAKTVTLTLSSAVANGDTVTVSYTAGTNKLQDIAGNTAANLTDRAVTNGTSDTTPPAKPVVSGISTDTGDSSTDGLTKDQTLVISGTAEANSTVTVFVDGTSVGTTTADGSGNWSFDYTGTTLAEGSHAITAKATDAANNTSAASDAFTAKIDITATTSVTTPSDTKLSATEDGSVSLSGTVANVEDGNTITVTFSDGTHSVQKTATITSGAWSVTGADLSTLNEGSVNVTTSVTDDAGNVSTTTNNGLFTIDRTAPSKPVVTSISTDSGTSGSDGKTNDTTLTISGTAEANSTVQVLIGGTSIGTTTADGSGNWSLDHTGTTFAEGSYSITAKATDAAGNTSVTSNAFTAVVDTTAPVLSTASVSGTSLVLTYTEAGVGFDASTPATTDFVVKDGASTISVSNVAVDTTAKTVTLTLSSAVANGDTVTVSYTAGTNKLQDIAGNTAANLTDRAVTNGTSDTTPPAKPVVSGVSTDTGDSSTDGLTKDQTLVISGTAEANSTVTVFVDGTSVGTTTADGSGNWSFDYTGTTLAEGSHAITAKATDAANNTSAASDAFTAKIDITATTSVTTPSDTKLSATEDGSVSLSGTVANVEDGNTITVTFSDGTHSVQKTATITSGAWSVTGADLSTLNEGSVNVTTSVTDDAGNVSTTTNNGLFTIDRTAPGKPVVTAISTDTGDSSADGLTKDQTLVISGTAEANSTVQVLVDGTSIGTTTADGSGNWSFDHTGTTLAEGSHAITAKATDAAGNSSAVSDAFTAKIDITASTTVTTPADTKLSATEDGSVSLSGTVANVEDGNTITVTFSDGTHSVQKTATIAGGAWSVTGADLSTLNEGSVTVTTSVTDDAGNVSTTTNNGLFTIDRTAPAKPVVTSISTDSGTSGSDGKTNDATLTISGTAEANGTVQVLIDGTAIGTTTADGSGHWTLDHTGTTLAEGAYAITAKATDAAGNTSLVSDAFTAVVDTTAPALSSATVDGTTLVLTYAEAGVGFDTATPATTDFVVKDGASTITVTNVAVNTTAKTVTLTLQSGVAYGDTVSVSYTGGANKLQDVAGNAAANLGNHAVTNNTEMPTAANNDTGAATEAGGVANGTVGTDASGAVLSNDTGTTIKVTAASVGTTLSGAPTTVAASGTTRVAGAHGTLTIDASGTYTYAVNNSDTAVEALNAGDSVTDTFTYRITDQNGHTADATVTITIAGRNDAPVAPTMPTPTATVGGAMTPVTIPAFTDVDNGALTYTATLADGAALPTWLTFDPTTRTLSGTPPAGTPVGALALKITATDGSLSTSGTVTLTVANPGAPVASADIGSATEAGGVANATPGSSASGSVLSNDTGTAIKVTAADAGGSLGSGARTINGGSTSVAGAYGSLAIGADGQYSYTLDNANATVQALNAGGTLTDTFTYRITDQAGQTATATLTVTVRGANDAPVAPTLPKIDATVGTGLNGVTLPAFTDVDNAHLTYTATLADGSALPAWLTFDPNTRALSGTPPAGIEAGTLSLKITATDGSLSASATVDLAVANPTAPTATADTASATEAGGVANATAGVNPTGNLLANDQGQGLTITAVASGSTGGKTSGSLVAQGAYGTLTVAADGSYTYTLNNDAAAVQALNTGDTLQDTFSYRATDKAGQSATATLAVTIHGANDAAVPGTMPDGGTVKVGEPLQPIVVPAFTDIDNAHLTYTATLADGSALPAWLTFDPNTRAFSGTPPAGTVPGTLTVKVTASDGSLSSSAVLTLTVALPAKPVAADDSGTAKEAGGVDNGTAGADAAGNVLANDRGSQLTVTDVQLGATVAKVTGRTTVAGAYGTLTIGPDGSYVYTVDNGNPTVEALNDGATLTEQFTYRTTDAAGQTATAVLSVTVSGTTDVPPPLPVVPPVVPPVAQPPVSTPTPSRPTSVPVVITVDPVIDSVSFRAPSVSSADGGGSRLGDVLSRSPDALSMGGATFGVVVIPSDVPSLMIYRGVPDQFCEANTAINFTIPTDAFAHTRTGAQVTLTAALTDGAPLPPWLVFNKMTGTFEGIPPKNFIGELKIKVIAIDQEGLQAEAIFRFNIGGLKPTSATRTRFSEQMRRLAYFAPRRHDFAGTLR